MRKRLLALLLVLSMALTVVPMAAAAEVYIDVDSDAWYADSVDYVTRNGLMNGTGDGLFSPNGSATRGAVMTILARTAGVDTTVGSTWYEAGLNWAVAGGVSDGSNPLDNITREQLATILYRYAAMIGCDMNYWQPLNSFTDADKVSDYAVEALEWAVAVGLMEGSNNNLMPKATATRAQLAAILNRYAQNVLALDDAADDVDFGLWPGWWMDQSEPVDTWDGTADTSWYDEENPQTSYELSTAEALAGLASLVDSGTDFAGKTFTLTQDLDLAATDENGEPVSFDPIGDEHPFNGIFDGNGKTISNLYQSGWAFGYEWGSYGSVGLFGEIQDATIKNLTVSGAESLVEGGDIGGITGSASGNCVFENITIEDSVFATYNNGNGGIIGWSGSGNYTFKNITIAEDVTLAGLWGSFDSSIGGVVGQGEPGATYNFENVDIKCRLDVYNDVTASYDYYNYRMCGMIIGRLRETTTINGRNYPDTSKYNITCSNVTVTYGDWSDYHYCRASGARGKRVEAGYSYDGIAADYDHSVCTVHHLECIPFDQIFGGAQFGVTGLPSYNGVEVIYAK